MEESENRNELTNTSTSSSDGNESVKFKYLESRFECPICLTCLKSPYITSCGHKFCKDCIQQWLKKEGGTCPIDSQKLSQENDIFPDNYTKREISQQVVTCPFPDCSKALPLLEAEKHMFEVHDDDEISTNDRKCCPFSKVGCKFELESQSQVVCHLHTYMSHHLVLLLNAYERLSCDVRTLERDEEAGLWDPPSKSEPLPSTLIKTLYEKIVFLEQTDQEKSIDLSAVKGQLKNVIQHNISELPRRTGGVLMWKITNTSQTLRNMFSDSTVKLFSEGFYTSYFGYKFCCRLNANPCDTNYLSLNVHLMKGESDYALNWPFCGRISIVLIHPTISDLSIREVMVSNPSIEAFKRPKKEIALRGFGYADFVRISDLFDQNFIGQDDSVHIRVEVVCI